MMTTITSGVKGPNGRVLSRNQSRSSDPPMSWATPYHRRYRRVASLPRCGLPSPTATVVRLVVTLGARSAGWRGASVPIPRSVVPIPRSTTSSPRSAEHPGNERAARGPADHGPMCDYRRPGRHMTIAMAVNGRYRRPGRRLTTRPTARRCLTSRRAPLARRTPHRPSPRPLHRPCSTPLAAPA